MYKDNGDGRSVVSVLRTAHGKSELFTSNAVIVVLILAGISAIAYSLWGLLLKYNEVSRVAVFGFLTPIFGVVFSVIFLREDSGQSVEMVLLALALVSIGTIMVQKKEKE